MIRTRDPLLPKQANKHHISFILQGLSCLTGICPGLFPGLGQLLQRGGKIVLAHVRISRGRLNRGVIERLLYQLHIAGCPK